MLDLRRLGRRIAERREACGYTQEELAKALAIPRSAVSRLENGQRDLSYAEVQVLSRFLGVDPEWFLTQGDFEEQFAVFRQAAGDRITPGVERANEILAMLVRHEQLYHRFGLVEGMSDDAYE